MGISIRYANKDDAEALARINEKSFHKAFKGIIPEDVLNDKFSFESLRDRLYKELSEGRTTNCIVFKDDIPVGMQTFAKDDYRDRGDSEIDIWRVYLLPEYWGQNIAVEFMNWGLDELKKNGYKKVSLWVVDENTRARRFYEKVGFSHDGEIRVINPGREVSEYRYTREL